MTYKNKNQTREHNRLTVKIKRWREQGKDITELLKQREALKVITNNKDITDMTSKDITKDITPRKKRYDNKSYDSKKDDPRINQILLKLEQQELERKLFHFEISEMVNKAKKEWGELKLEISQIKQTLSDLVSPKQVPIVRTARKKKNGKLTRQERKRKDGISYYFRHRVKVLAKCEQKRRTQGIKPSPSKYQTKYSNAL